MKQIDYLIIGAGIVGCSTAYFLSKQARSVMRLVMVVDQSYACNEASGVNAGGIELLQQPPESLPLHIEAADLWDEFQNKDGIDVGYHRTGGLYAITDPNDEHMLDEQQERFAKYGLEAKRLDRKELEKMVTGVAEACIAANFSPKSADANPLKAGVALLLAARENGVSFMDHQQIKKIVPVKDGEGYEAIAEDEVFRAKKILISSGIRSPRLLDALGVHIAFQEQHNMVTVTEKAPHFLDYTFTTPTLTMKQTDEGSILIGGGREGYGDLEKNIKDVSINNLCFNVREAASILPQVSKLNILRSWSGFEGFTDNRLPKMGMVPEYPEIYYAVTGFCGFAIGPAVGKHACAMLTGQEA